MREICSICNHPWRRHYPMSGCLEEGNNHDYEDGRGRCYCIGVKVDNKTLLSDGHGGYALSIKSGDSK